MSTTYTTSLKLRNIATSDRMWDVPLNANVTLLDGLNALGGLNVSLHEIPSTSLNVAVAAGGYIKADGTAGSYAGTASQAMTASVTNYVYLTDAGTLTISTSSFPTTGNYVPLATVAAGSTTITSITDARQYLRSANGHAYMGVGIPTIAAGAGAGTGPTVSISGSDQAGVVTILTGSSPSTSSVVATVSFGMAWLAAPRAVVITPANGTTAALSGNGAVYADVANVTTAHFQLSVGSSALAATTTYKFFFMVIG